MHYRYEVKPRPVELGGGWSVKLYEDDLEVGGAVFPEPSEKVEAIEFGEDWLSSRPRMDS